MTLATSVAQELVRVAGKNGGILRAADVVKDAESENSPLHSHFEWDQTAAAYQFRLVQARQLIRVVAQYVGPEPMECRVFVSLPEDRKLAGGGYRVTAEVMADDVLRDQLLREALIAMRRFESRYRGLQALAGVFEAMREAQIAA